MILTNTYWGINRSFSDRLRLSVILEYPANGNRSLVRIIEVLLYFWFPLQQWLYERVSVLGYTYNACPVASVLQVYRVLCCASPTFGHKNKNYVHFHCHNCVVLFIGHRVRLANAH
jgi:hypothetical protein